MAADLRFGRLGYGAANLGNLFRPISDEEAWQLCATAWDHGVRYFDTAPHYGLGLSERRLGAFLRTKPRSEFVVSTKAGRLLRRNPAFSGELDLENDFIVPADLHRVWDFSPDGIRTSLDESLERLGLDSVDVLYLHDPEKSGHETELSTALETLVALRAEGVLAGVGVGSMNVEMLVKSAQSAPIDLVMVAGRYTLVDHSAHEVLLGECTERGIKVVNAAVFNSGLLATDVPNPAGHYDYGDAPRHVLDLLDAILAVCEEFGVPLPAAALQYGLRSGAVATIVAGGGKPRQIAENVARMSFDIPSGFWDSMVDLGLIPE
jgi:D-threo-aldose 1-dehydrogenase